MFRERVLNRGISEMWMDLDRLGCFGKGAEAGNSDVEVLVTMTCRSCGDALGCPEGRDGESGGIRQGVNKLSAGGSVNEAGSTEESKCFDG